VFFHPVYCNGRKAAPGSFNKGDGWEMVQRPKGTLLEDLRQKALKGWIEHLQAYKFPEKRWASSKDDGDAPRGMPPGGERISFNTNGADMTDDRRQIPIRKEGDLPREIKLEEFMRYVAWNIYNVVNQRGVVGEFTRYVPHPNPISSSRGRASIAPGEYPLVKGTTPVHLYIKDLFLLFGGFQVMPDGSLPGEEDECIHQPAHSDINNEFFGSADKCPLLYGLEAPFTFNTAVEDERSIWVKEVANKITVMKNETLCLSCDTVHGGWTYKFERYGPNPKYHPSLHMVVSSLRYPKSHDKVNLKISPVTYMPLEHFRHIDDAQFTKKYDGLIKVGMQMVEDLKVRKRRGVPNRVKEGLEDFERIFGIDPKESERKLRGKSKRKRDNYI
jgi:hypothetical protein